jgi:hypothetical protein
MMGDLFLEWEDLAQATTMFADFFVCRLRFGMRPPPSQPQTPNNRIELRYYRFQTDGEIRILFSALVNWEVI